MKDWDYMWIALELAKKGCGFVNPNPMVGAVIVKNGEIIGQGYHERYGGYHAERNALANCRESPEGSVMYVTLEPCCHHGKTPPCTEAIIESGIGRVVVGTKDRNPVVEGKGIEILQKHGIEVTVGVLEKECNELNEVFFHYIKNKKPFIVMKYAMTMDGKIATYTGKSKWITGDLARENVHRDRHKYSAVMVGVDTIIADDPTLTCRIKEGRNPIRIICDTNLRTPLESRVITSAKAVATLIATANTDMKTQELYINNGCKIITVSKKDGHIDLRELIKKLGEGKIDSILLEGGGTLNWAAMESGIVNKVQVYIAPKLFGGKGAKTPIEGTGIDFPNESFLLVNTKIIRFDEDILIESEVVQKCLLE